MGEKKWKELSTEELQQKENSLKVLLGLLGFLGLALFYCVLRDYWQEGEMEWAMFTIAICTVGGGISIYPELRAVRQERKLR